MVVSAVHDQQVLGQPASTDRRSTTEALLVCGGRFSSNRLDPGRGWPAPALSIWAPRLSSSISVIEAIDCDQMAGHCRFRNLRGDVPTPWRGATTGLAGSIHLCWGASRGLVVHSACQQGLQNQRRKQEHPERPGPPGVGAERRQAQDDDCSMAVRVAFRSRLVTRRSLSAGAESRRSRMHLEVFALASGLSIPQLSPKKRGKKLLSESGSRKDLFIRSTTQIA